MPARVCGLERLSDDVMRLLLRLPARKPWPYAAGQDPTIEWPGGPRAFSMAGSHRGDALLELRIGRVPGGALTQHAFSGLRIDDVLRIKGPYGQFGF